MISDETCHQDLAAIYHWQCSECGHFEPWCYAGSDDYHKGKRFERCPGCGRVVDWDYWRTHLAPGETWEGHLARMIVEEVIPYEEAIDEDDGLPVCVGFIDPIRDPAIEFAEKLLSDGIEPNAVRKAVRDRFNPRTEG